MKKNQLKIIKETNMFGTSVTLSHDQQNYNKCIVENLENDPFAKMVKKDFADGYLYRSPDISEESLAEAFSTFSGFSGSFYFIAERVNNKITALVRIKDFADASMFAWHNVEVWQKWSDAEQKESLKENKNKVLKVNKDGTVKVNVSIESLEDDR